MKKVPNFVLGSQKFRPPHHLGGAHKLGAAYSPHRAPSTYPLRDGSPSWPARGGWVKTGNASGFCSAAASQVQECVSARLGWAGDKCDLFDQPVLIMVGFLQDPR